MIRFVSQSLSLSSRYHQACFNCKHCNVALLDRNKLLYNVFVVDGQPYCDVCIRKMGMIRLGKKHSYRFVCQSLNYKGTLNHSEDRVPMSTYFSCPTVWAGVGEVLYQNLKYQTPIFFQEKSRKSPQKRRFSRLSHTSLYRYII